MSSRDEILANFQAFTGLEDIGTCINILEQHSWDLLSAVNSIIPQDFTSQEVITPIQESGRDRGEIVDLTEPTVHIDLTQDKNTTDINGVINPLEPHPPEPHPQISVESQDNDEEDTESEYDDARETLSEEVITDDMFEDDLTITGSQDPLIPINCDDSVEALNYFSSRFTLRYGDVHPLFYLGSLSDAVKEATGGSVSKRKPMFIYLHHDKSILSNIFCSQLLCCDSIVNYLSLHYLVWAWDLTHENLKRKLLDMVGECFGQAVAANVDDIKPEHLPVILIVFKAKGQTDVRNIIQGHTDPDTLLSSLILANEQHQGCVELDRMEENERLAREQVKSQQEAAFRESLLADQEKERQKQVEEELRKKIEMEQLQEQERKEEERQRMEDSIPPEPSSDCTDKVAILRLRFPDGSTDQRRFLATHTIQMLLNYIGSKGYHPEEFKLLTSFPKKDITQIEDVYMTLESARLFPQETLFIEER